MASLADIALHRALTPAAGDIAAPVVLAVAPLDHAVCVGVVTTPTAHEVAAVTAVGCLVALPGGWEAEVSKCSSPHSAPVTPARQLTGHVTLESGVVFREIGVILLPKGAPRFPLYFQ
jgi:hypothetical protein